MKFKDIMFSDLSEDEMKSLSGREMAMWLSRPTHGGPKAKIFMLIRSGLIVLGYLYFKDFSEARALVLLVGMYEFAYYLAVRDKLELEYQAARERYIERARCEGLISAEAEA